MATQTLLPIATVDPGAWSIVGAPTAHEALDADTASDSAYLSSNGSPNARLTFQKHGLPDGTTIDSVALAADCKKIVGGAAEATITLYLHIGGADYQIASSTVISTDYLAISGSVATNPATGLAWQTDELHAMAGRLGLTQGIGLPKTTVRVGRFYLTPTYTPSTVHDNLHPTAG